MGAQAGRTILDSLLGVGKITTASISQSVQGAIAKHAAKAFRICALVTGKIFTFFILEEIIICHIFFSLLLCYNIKKR
jgi:hypothetical protein